MCQFRYGYWPDTHYAVSEGSVLAEGRGGFVLLWWSVELKSSLALVFPVVPALSDSLEGKLTCDTPVLHPGAAQPSFVNFLGFWALAS